MRVTYEAPPTMGRFMESDAFVRAVVGPVGSGKSSGCLMEIVRRAQEQRPGPDGIRRTRFAVIRNTYPQLRDTTRKTFEQWVPARLGHWREQEFTFHMKFKDVDCEVLFRALDRPEDVKKLLSLELTGAYINEAREVPKHVFDVLQTRVGRYPSKAQGGPSWFGIWMDTNPWHTGHEFYRLFSKQKPEGFELFEQPDGLGPEAENVENLPPGYYERLTLGKDSEWVDEYVRGKYPSADKGSVYGDLIAGLEKAGGVVPFEHPKDGVFVSLDLGISDSTALWFWRLNRYGVADLVDWYEASGEALSHFFSRIDSSGYDITKIWLPHDARARTLQTGVSTLDLFLKRYPGKVAIGPDLSLEDGIGAARWMLEQPMRIHARCADGVERLRAYKYQWDEDRKVFGKKPLHDWTSHTADAFRYVACVVQATASLMRKPEKTQPKPVGRMRVTLDQLLDENGLLDG